MLRASLLFIIRRYYSVYTVIGVMSCIYADWLIAGSCQQPVNINTWHIPVAVHTE